MKRLLIIATIAISFLAGTMINRSSQAAPTKPLTTLGLSKTLLNLAEKAEGQEMFVEAEAIKSIIPTILTGTPASQIKPATALCDTDTDCKRKFNNRR